MPNSLPQVDTEDRSRRGRMESEFERSVFRPTMFERPPVEGVQDAIPMDENLTSTSKPKAASRSKKGEEKDLFGASRWKTGSYIKEIPEDEEDFTMGDLGTLQKLP
eukprot:CAMPEP_0167744744 /NCGR_PEP_ID=MMETSP0110_2-20121227/2760_1 /TAXON_ID=629695 /ORGANISM="Gymnochlora sp., Strain CCMP2014" /LENGTH=105 /DNA_ID=CAMNT_0007629297 /DNA_START=188 /DNA_END=505 /DNA_ORIENTATION=-